MTNHYTRIQTEPAQGDTRLDRLHRDKDQTMKKVTAAIITLLAINVVQAQEDLFREKEQSIFGFGSYVDKHDSDVAPGVGLSYFFTRNLGVSASTFWENTTGSFIDNVSGEVTYRLPLRDLPLAPYGLVGVGYSFESEETFGYFGGGAEWRFSPKWGAFADLRWQMNNDTDNGVGVRFGARYVF